MNQTSRAITAAPAIAGRAQAVADPADPSSRRFLMLQGPHGPFFARLAAMLTDAGSQVWRVGFNAGDAFFWRDQSRYIPYRGGDEDWPAALDALLTRWGITDIVLYGDIRPRHAAAAAAARARGLTLHVFEEGYLRPFWITYERDGSNGYSPLMTLSLAEMAEMLRGLGPEIGRAPARWGDMRQHKFYGALYHFVVTLGRRNYPKFRSHRDIAVMREFTLNLRRLLETPLTALRSRVRGARLRRSGHPYALVLMQLAHDSNFLGHSPYRSQAGFVTEVLEAFTRAAPRHHHIAFKSHPLEDGRGGAEAMIRDTARQLGVAARVHLLPGGKLAPVLAQARAVVTVNSTAAQQALWRGLPVKAMGRAVYDKPGLVSDQPLDAFFRSPARPDPDAYRLYRRFLLETSQVPGGFYAARSRAHALRLIVDLMLDPDSPQAALAKGRAAHRQQIDTESG